MAGDVWQTVATAVDILVVAAILYSLMTLARGTRAWQILGGLIALGGIFLLSALLQLRTLNWLVQQVVPLAPVALVILFYPELRYALEEMGRVQFWRNRLRLLPREDIHRLIDELVKVTASLSQRRIGALVVVEREEGLDDLIATGTRLDAQVSAELLETVFHPGTTLHDGAVIVRGDRVVAAGCLLPLTDSPAVAASLHTRHRAAIGVSERSDALAVVVSEETGAISLSADGHLVRGLKAETLRRRLAEALIPANGRNGGAPLWRAGRAGARRS
ncbi:MAG: TIGR00159 family protein [Armatimonadetes bacterium]|nr:TIGR00159 family protein [Armatimonadota bacterium]